MPVVASGEGQQVRGVIARSKDAAVELVTIVVPDPGPLRGRLPVEFRGFRGRLDGEGEAAYIAAWDAWSKERMRWATEHGVDALELLREDAYRAQHPEGRR